MEVCCVLANRHHILLDHIFDNGAKYRFDRLEANDDAIALPVVIQSVFVTTLLSNSKRMVNGISDNYHFPAISVSRYVWYSTAKRRDDHRLNRWLTVSSLYPMRDQPNDRNVRSIPKQDLDALRFPRRQWMYRNCPKITNQNQVPKEAFVHRLGFNPW